MRIFGRSGRGVEDESMGWGSGMGEWRQLVETKVKRDEEEGKTKSTTGISASLAPDYSDNEESNIQVLFTCMVVTYLTNMASSV